VNFDYFKNEIEGMILNVPVAASLGVLTTELLRISVLWKTLDEFGIDASIINNGAFKWNVNTNLTCKK
jgi:hypothetical protein